MVQEWISGNLQNRGVLLSALTSKGNSIPFYSNDYSPDSALRPTLMIDYFYPPSCPDLVVSSSDIGFSKAIVIEGDTIKISTRVYNTGHIPAFNVPIRFYNGLPGLGQYEIIGETTIPFIAGYGHWTATTNWVTSGRSGNQVVFSWVNPEGTIAECDTINNKAAALCHVSRKPDLTASCANVLATSTIPAEGDTITLRLIVENNDEGPVHAYRTSFYVGNPQAGGILQETLFSSDTLWGWDRDTLLFTWETESFPGGHQLYFVIDDNNTVAENLEANNVVSCPISVYNPNLVLISACRPNANANDTLTYRVSAKNVGAVEARNLQLVVSVPASVKIESSTPKPDSGFESRWTLTSLGPEAQANFTLIAKVSATTTPGTIVDIGALLTYSNSHDLVQPSKLTSNSIEIGADISPPQLLVTIQPSIVNEETVMITCAPSETLAVSPTVVAVAANGDTLIASLLYPDSGAYHYSTIITPTTPGGKVSLKLTAVDLAGNSGSTTTFFTVDHEAPSALVTVNDTLSSGTHSLRIASSEHLGGDPLVSLLDSTGDSVMVQPLSHSGLVYDYRILIDDNTSSGKAFLSIQLHDLVLNENLISDTIFVLNERPRITAQIPQLFPEGTTQFKIYANKSLLGFPIVRGFDSRSVRLDIVGPIPRDSGYVYWCRVKTATAEGLAHLTISVTDRYGNTADTTASFTIDKTGPSLAVEPNNLALTAGSQLTVTASERLGEEPRVLCFGSEGMSLVQLASDSSSNAQVYFYTFGLDDTVSWLLVEGTDLAGNNTLDTLSYVDLEVARNQLVFSNQPATGNDVLISTYIHNRGYCSLDSVSVSFWTDFPLFGTRIGNDTVISVRSGDSMLVTVAWPAPDQRASYVVYALVDANNRIVEFDESNNSSSRGSFAVVGASSKGNYVLGPDTSVIFYCRLVDVNTWSELNDTSSVTVTFDLRGADGTPIVLGDTLRYNYSTKYFSKIVTLDQQFSPQEYVAVFRGDIGGGSGQVDDTARFSVYLPAVISCQSNQTNYSLGKPVEIYGNVLRSDLVPYSSKQVEIYIQNKGGTRRFDDVTDSLGHYSYQFSPSPSESGDYLVFSRAIVGASEFRDSTQFQINGISVNPPAYILRMSQNSEHSITFSVTNIGMVPVRVDSITARPDSASRGIVCSINTTGILHNLSPGATTNFGALVSASSLATLRGFLSISVFYNDSLVKSSSVNVEVDPARPIIDVSNFNLEYRTIQGQTLTKRVTLFNRGYTTWRDLDLVKAAAPWLTVAFPADRDSLRIGEEFGFDVGVSVPDTMSLGVYDTSFSIISSNYPSVKVYVRAFVNAGAIGDLRFLVTSDQGDSLSGANVILYSQVFDPSSNSYPVYSRKTFDGGLADFLNLAANSYSYKISKDGYLSKAGKISVVPGQSLATPVYLSLEPQAVEMIWVVRETTVQDVYNLTLEVTYDTSVYISPPLIMIKPHVIAKNFDFDDPVPLFGSFDLVNAGEMQADDITIDWPELEQFSVHLYTPDGRLPGAVRDGLQPGESVSIPYYIELSPTISKCGEYESMFAVTGQYSTGGSVGTVQTFGKYLIGDKSCNYEILLEPRPLVFVTIPCWLTGNCECDISSFFVSQPVELRATNVGEGTPVLTNALPLRIGLPGLTVGIGNLLPGAGLLVWEMTQYYNNLLTIAANAGSEWLPSRSVAPGQTVKTNVVLASVPTGIGIVAEGGVVAVGAKWPTYEKVFYDPLFNVGITDMQLGRLLYCVIKSISLGYGETTSGAVQAGGGYGYPSGSGFGPLSGPYSASSDEGGLIKIVIKQQLGVERQGFEAYLEIVNKFQEYSIDNINVDIEVKDENGIILAPDQTTSSNPLFFSLTELSGLSDIDGGGSIPAGTSGRADWLIIPKKDAAGTSAGGKQYFLTARISYQIGGVDYTYSSQSEQITVLPQPLLNLTYFLPKYFQDNVPFKLGLKIDNIGAGTARNLRMDSEQPVAVQCVEAVERWEITSSYIEGEAESPSLLLNFGDVAAGASKTGYWNLEAAPGGEIVDFTANYEHDDGLGGSSTSLINSVNTYLILSDGVGINQSMPTGKHYKEAGKEFVGILVDENRDFNPDAVFNLVDGQRFDVTMALPIEIEAPSFENPILKVHVPADSQWIFFGVSDPFLGTRTISSITREDGSVLLETNFWIDSGYVYVCDNPFSNSFYVIQYASPVYKPDLEVLGDQIVIRPCDGCGVVDAGDTLVYLDAYVKNVGTRTADDVLIYFYDGPPIEGVLIDSAIVDSILPGLSQLVTTTWRVGPPADWALYYHRVHVEVDPHDYINELTNQNNIASTGADFALSMGDCDHRGRVDIGDVVYLVNFIFAAGPAPRPSNAGDVDCSGQVDITDVVRLVNYIFGFSGLCDPRLPNQKMTVPSIGEAELLLTSDQVSERQVALTLSGRFSREVGGLQFCLRLGHSRLTLVNAVAIDEARELPLYVSASKDSVLVGMIDISQRKTIPMAGGALIKLTFERNDDSSELNDLSVDRVVIAGSDGVALNPDFKINLGDLVLPKSFSLGQNYPNPFNPNTVIEFGLPRPCHVKLTVINILGQTVKKLVDTEFKAGRGRVVWDGTNSAGEQVASGVYFYRLSAGDYTQTRKMVLIK